MMKNMKIAVLGGGGRTGKFLISELVESGYSMRLLLRNPENFEYAHPSIEIVKGDATDPDAIKVLTKGCDAIISTVGQRKGEPLVASMATANILSAMQLFEIQRYVLVAGLNVDTPFDQKGTETRIATEWMKDNFKTIHDDRQRAYALLNQSILNWTLVRVPFIDFAESSGVIQVNLTDCPGQSIYAADLARFLVQQLLDSKYYRQSPFAASS